MNLKMFLLGASLAGLAACATMSVETTESKRVRYSVNLGYAKLSYYVGTPVETPTLGEIKVEPRSCTALYEDEKEWYALNDVFCDSYVDSWFGELDGETRTEVREDDEDKFKALDLLYKSIKNRVWEIDYDFDIKKEEIKNEDII